MSRSRIMTRLGPLASIAWWLLACGVTPEPEIAAEFYQRLAAEPVGWAPRPCSDREAKVDDLREVIAVAHDLRARIREFRDPIPPRLQDLLMRTPLLGRGTDYRCVIQDFVRIDLRTEPDYQDVVDFTANLYVLKATTLLEQGHDEEGWAHVLQGLELYARPVGPNVAEQVSLVEVLIAMQLLIEAHPPPRPVVTRLIAAVDATRVPSAVTCAAVRHELLGIAIGAFRAHFGQREREAAAQRWGLGTAMKMWRDHHAGQHGRSAWEAWKELYDGAIEGCGQRPFGMSVQRAATGQGKLDLLHPPTGVLARVATDRLNRAGPLFDAQVAMLATLHAMELRARLGRDPTVAELATAFGRRPRNPWDHRFYSFAVADGVVSIARAGFRYAVAIPAVG